MMDALKVTVVTVIAMRGLAVDARMRSLLLQVNAIAHLLKKRVLLVNFNKLTKAQDDGAAALQVHALCLSTSSSSRLAVRCLHA